MSNPTPVLQAMLDGYIDEQKEIGWIFDSENDTHLRIYGIPQIPAHLVSVYSSYLPPLEYDFGLLGLQKEVELKVSDLGDMPEYRYYDSLGGTLVCKRSFEFLYGTYAPHDQAQLTVTETPRWYTNNGTEISGPSKVQVYRGKRYNDWRHSARNRIFEALKEWVPLAMQACYNDNSAAAIASGIAEDYLTNETVISAGWFATTVPSVGISPFIAMDVYLASGNPGYLQAVMGAVEVGDHPAWLDLTPPDEAIPGFANGRTIRQLVLDSLR